MMPEQSPSFTPSIPSESKPPQRSRISVDTRWVAIGLLLVIIGMLIAWHPWSASNRNGSDRTIKVSGEATVKAEPDQYVFNPSYQFSDADRATALATLTKKNDELVAGLKKAGVGDGQIKSNANDYQSGGIYYSMPTPASNDKIVAPSPNYSLQLTVTVQDKALAQKVQDYLATTVPSGSVTPSSDFSTTKRKQLESQARDEATKDARSKADQSAKNLGFKVGSVKSVNDGSGFGAYPIASDTMMEVSPATAAGSTSSKLNIQPGENELSYSVSVEYYVR